MTYETMTDLELLGLRHVLAKNGYSVDNTTGEVTVARNHPEPHVYEMVRDPIGRIDRTLHRLDYADRIKGEPAHATQVEALKGFAQNIKKPILRVEKTE